MSDGLQQCCRKYFLIKLDHLAPRFFKIVGGPPAILENHPMGTDAWNFGPFLEGVKPKIIQPTFFWTHVIPTKDIFCKKIGQFPHFCNWTEQNFKDFLCKYNTRWTKEDHTTEQKSTMGKNQFAKMV